MQLMMMMMTMIMCQGPAGEKGVRGDSEIPIYDEKHRENVGDVSCVCTIQFHEYFTRDVLMSKCSNRYGIAATCTTYYLYTP